jgi:hypothetical protein
LENNVDRCECERRLRDFTTACNIGTDAVQRKGLIWLRYDEEYLKVHIHCPQGYCQVATDTINLASPDEQCADNHS